MSCNRCREFSSRGQRDPSSSPYPQNFVRDTPRRLGWLNGFLGSMCLASPRMPLLNTDGLFFLNTVRLLRVCIRNCARRVSVLNSLSVRGDATVSIAGDRGWHSWRTHDAEPAVQARTLYGHDVAGGIVGRYNARAIKMPTARAILGWYPRYELNVRQTDKVELSTK